MARIVNPYNLDDDDDAVFSALLSQGLIWVEDDDDDDSDESEIEEIVSISGVKTRTLKGHTSSVNALAISGDFAVSASSDETLRVWNWKTGQRVRTLSGHTDSVNALAISGDFAVSASSDRTLRVWNWRTGQHIRTLNGYTQAVSALDLDADIVASASFGDIWVWNWQTGEHLQTLNNTWHKSGYHKNGIALVAVDGDFVLSYSSSPDILLVRNWRTGERLHKLTKSCLVGQEKSIAVNKDIVAIIDENHPDIHLWNWKTGKHLSRNGKHRLDTSPVKRMVFLTPLGVCSFQSHKTNQWSSYLLDSETGYNDTVIFVEDYSHIIRGDYDGVIHVTRLDPSLLRLITGKSSEPHSDILEKKRETETIVMRDYDIDDVLQVARLFIRKRGEEWVNFTRVSQHCYRAFHDLNPKRLGTPSKKYQSLLRLLEDYPSDFELRKDASKQGLYWIRLKPTR